MMPIYVNENKGLVNPDEISHILEGTAGNYRLIFLKHKDYIKVSESIDELYAKLCAAHENSLKL